jgi:hypothetical protein
LPLDGTPLVDNITSAESVCFVYKVFAKVSHDERSRSQFYQFAVLNKSCSSLVDFVSEYKCDSTVYEGCLGIFGLFVGFGFVCSFIA